MSVKADDLSQLHSVLEQALLWVPCKACWVVVCASVARVSPACSQPFSRAGKGLHCEFLAQSQVFRWRFFV